MFPFRPTRVLLIPFRRASERNLKVASRVSSLVAPAEGMSLQPDGHLKPWQ